MGVKSEVRVIATQTLEEVARKQSLQLQLASTGLASINVSSNAGGGTWVKRDSTSAMVNHQELSVIAPFKGIRREHME